ncbi:MAG: YggU family protein [Methanobacteriota archaeon]|nr:MAG: YggU family protein [Euryarchaeota archaeon]
MIPHSYLMAVDEGVLLAVEVSPGAKQTAISGINEWRSALQVRVAAPPEKGRANMELRRYLSERLSLQPSDVRIIKGARSRHKTIFVRISPDEFKRRMQVK